MFIVALFIQPIGNNSSVNKIISKMWCIHSMEYYWANKKNKQKNKKNRATDKCYNQDESHTHAKSEKPDTKTTYYMIAFI